MLSSVRQEPDALASWAPPWLPEATFWLGVALCLVAVAGAAGVWTLVARARRLGQQAERLRSLEVVEAQLERFVAERGDLDLRRVEHVLVDVRDGLRRLEDALLRSVESPPPPGTELVPRAPGAAGEGLGERVTNRVLALGYERVQLVTRAEKLAELGSKDGEVLIEARRGGVVHKGRVLVRGGRLAEVEIHPAYSIFP